MPWHGESSQQRKVEQHWPLLAVSTSPAKSLHFLSLWALLFLFPSAPLPSSVSASCVSFLLVSPLLLCILNYHAPPWGWPGSPDPPWSQPLQSWPRGSTVPRGPPLAPQRGMTRCLISWIPFLVYSSSLTPTPLFGSRVRRG